MVTGVPRRCRTMTWAARKVIGNRRPQAVNDQVYKPGSRTEAESLRSEVAHELDCRVTKLRVMHVQSPPTGV